MADTDQEIVLTPLRSGHVDSYAIRIARIHLSQLNKAEVQHFAGGPYKGIIINKASATDKFGLHEPDSERAFTAYIASSANVGKENEYKREKRLLRFWFEAMAKVNEAVIKAITDKFMKELLHSEKFPKDYISFVKRMLTMVRRYTAIERVEVLMRPMTGEDEDDEVVLRRDATLPRGMKLPTQEAMNRLAGEGGRKTPTQEDAHRLADGSLVNEQGYIISRADSRPATAAKPAVAPRLTKQNAVSHDEPDSVASAGRVASTTSVTSSISVTSSEIVTSAGARGQEDWRHLADGTVVDKHGNVVQNGSLSASQGSNQSIMRRKQQNGSDKPSEGNEAVGQSGDISEDARSGASVRRQPTITRKGWEMIWAVKKQKLLTLLEDAYPNALHGDELVRTSYLKPADVEYLLGELQLKGMVKEIGQKRWIRMQQERKLVIRRQRNSRASRTSMELSMDESDPRRHEFKMVTHVPHLEDKQQPTIAVITLLYCEKLAVDAMMDFKTTYIRIKKAEGEGLVYTVGMIGGHRVVATKLPRIGHGENATVSAGNSITRLLGTFSRIEHVILVGVGGGVADLQHEYRHVRLGDIVATTCSPEQQPAYVHLDSLVDDTHMKTTSWRPRDNLLSDIVAQLHSRYRKQAFFDDEWEGIVRGAERELHGDTGDTRFTRPAPDTDKLYQMQPEGEVDLDHPQSPTDSMRIRFPDRPVIHLGPVGTGKQLNKDPELRDSFAHAYGVRCVDSGFQAVMDSIEGNRKESFSIIRGVADYEDGAQKRDWQPYASLVAAAFMKAVILEIPRDSDSDEED